MMRRSHVVASVAGTLVFAMALGQTPASAQYGAYAPVEWQYGSPESLDRIGDVLSAIDSPSRRSALAENWLQFSKSAITRNLELRDQWLSLQKQQMNQDQRAEQQRLEMAKLQMQIEQLRAENLRLERENLQIRMEMNGRAAPQTSNGAGARGQNAPTP